jgi:hypothetical protein
MELRKNRFVNAEDRRTIEELKDNPAVTDFLWKAVMIYRKFGNCAIQVCHGNCKATGWHHLDYQMDFKLTKPDVIDVETIEERLALMLDERTL